MYMRHGQDTDTYAQMRVYVCVCVCRVRPYCFHTYYAYTRGYSRIGLTA